MASSQLPEALGNKEGLLNPLVLTSFKISITGELKRVKV
jgi:hypothetical protein